MHTRSTFKDAFPVLLAFLVSSMPILWVTFPPVLDYPNHLARIWLLAGRVGEPPLSSMYMANWSQASTNIAVDFAASSLARVVPFAIIDKLLLLVMFLGPPMGGIMLHRTVFGEFQPWQLAILALAWSTTATAGFLNFQISLAAALFCAVPIQPRSLGSPLLLIAYYLCSAGLVLLIHPFGLLFYAALVTGLLIGDRVEWPVNARHLLCRARDVAILAVTCAMPLVLLFWLAPIPPGAHSGHASGIVWQQWSALLNPVRILKMMASPVLTYDAFDDLLLTAPLLIVVAAALVADKLRVHTGLLIAAAALFLVALVAPNTVGDATWIQRRIPPMVALTVATAIQPAFEGRRANAMMLTVLAATLVVRVAWIGRIWIDREVDFTHLMEAASKIPAGSSVIVVQQHWTHFENVPLGRAMIGGPRGAVETERHLAALAAVKYRFFIPTLFTVPGQQPLSVRPEWKTRSVYASSIPTPEVLGTDDPADPYVKNWRRDFEYLLVINADLERTHPMSAVGLQLLSDRGFAKVYKILQQ